MLTIEQIRSRPVDFSGLKRMALSPAHYRAALEEPATDTPAMRLGRTVHALVLGGHHFVVYPGERRGKAWLEFRDANEGHDIITLEEEVRANRMAESIGQHDLAREYLAGQHEVPLKWRFADRACATRGVDVIGERWVTELKTSTTSAPWRFGPQAIRMHYHAQLAWYAEAARLHGYTVECGYVVVVESSSPYVVTTFEVTPRAMVDGNKLCRLWIERLKVCEASDEWPGYVQSTVPLDVPDDEPELTFGGEDGET